MVMQLTRLCTWQLNQTLHCVAGLVYAWDFIAIAIWCKSLVLCVQWLQHTLIRAPCHTHHYTSQDPAPLRYLPFPVVSLTIHGMKLYKAVITIPAVPNFVLSYDGTKSVIAGTVMTALYNFTSCIVRLTTGKGK